jgi:hypothetical protein
MPQDEYFEANLAAEDACAARAAAELAEERAGRLASAQLIWGDIPHDRRVEWSRVQLDFPPMWLGTLPMIYTSRAVSENSYTNMSAWVDVAHAFEAVGFSPDDYYLLRLCLPGERVPEREHPFITVVTSPGGFVCRTLNANDWALWPDLLRSGMTPLRATSFVLNHGNPIIPDGIIMDGTGKVVLSTDD